MRILLLVVLTTAIGCNYLWHKRFGGDNEIATGTDDDAPRTVVDDKPPVRPAHLDEDQLDLSKDISLYADYCKQELGLPPDILPPWNCLDGQELPITVDGEPINNATHAAIVEGHGGCDRPAWLGDKPCATYTFVQRRDLSSNVIAYLLCRKREYSTAATLAQRRANYLARRSMRDFAELFDFDSIGLIWANMQTGKTCFFDFVGKTYGGYVPSPDDYRRPSFSDLPDPKPPVKLAPGSRLSRIWEKNGKETWKEPRESANTDFCIRCHDAMPFKSSPYINQIFSIPIPPREVPYTVVGKVYERWRREHPLVAISTTPVNGEPQLCTRCHRIGSQETCKTFFHYATARQDMASLSKLGKSFALRAWMPPWPETWKDKPEHDVERLWNESYSAHVEKLACCCKTPQAKGCTRQDLEAQPLADPIIGTGPESCE